MMPTNIVRSSSSSSSDDDDDDRHHRKDVMKIELAGIGIPSYHQSSSTNIAKSTTTTTTTNTNGGGGGDIGHSRPPPTPTLPPLLEKLVKDEACVKIQLLGRKKKVATATRTTKRETMQMHHGHYSSRHDDDDYDEQMIAVCRLYYRPHVLWSIFWPTDIAESLVKYGQTVVYDSTTSSNNSNNDSEEGNDEDDEHHTKNSTTTTFYDVSSSIRPNIDDLRRDIKYLEHLTKLETQAIKGRYGIWNDASVRKTLRPDIVEELEFQQSSSTLQKVWRFIRRRLW